MRLHGEAAARTMGGALDGPAGMFTGVSIDSRTLAPRDLFFAIRGPRFDGHDFVPHAFVKGAAGAVVEDTFEYPKENLRDRFLVRVPDPTKALGALAREERRKSGAQIVAITGSLGKTTTKEAAAAAIGAVRSVFSSFGNLNNQWGLPLSLLARDDEEVGVVELGMSAPGEVRTLTEIAEPDVGLVTNVADAHLEFFGSIERIAEAKGELFEVLPAGATAVVNVRDKRVRKQSERFRGRKLTYGFRKNGETDPDVCGSDYTSIGGQIEFAVSAFGETAFVESPILGEHQALNLLAALAAAAALKVPLFEAVKGLQTFRALPGRGRRTELLNGAVLVDETYNSSPWALETVLAELDRETHIRRLPRVNARLVLVVGDMRELGEEAEALHRRVGHSVHQHTADWVVGVGRLGRIIAKTAEALGTHASFVETPEEAAALLQTALNVGDLVLFKASRAVGLERAVEALRTEIGDI